MTSCEEPAEISNVDSVVSVNTYDKAKGKKFIWAKFSLDSGKKFLIIFRFRPYISSL